MLAGGFVSLAGASSTPPAPDTDIPVRDGTLLYVRYGLPGGVHLARGHGVPAREDTAGAVTGAVVDSAGSSLAAILRELLREELASLGPASQAASEEEAGATGSTSGTETGVSLTLDRDSGDTRSLREVPSPEEIAARATEGSGSRLREEGGRERRTILAPIPVPLGSEMRDTVVVTVRDTVIVREAPVTLEHEILRREFLGHGLIETNLLLFEVDGAGILPHSTRVLESIAAVLREFPAARVRIEGHTDDTGSEAHNLDLSRRRAEAVMRWLVEAGGLEPDRFETEGFGESRPLGPNRTATERAVNRRVVLRVINPEVLREAIEER